MSTSDFTTALIDADIICYEFGNMKNADGTDVLPFPIVRGYVDARVQTIIDETGANEIKLYLTNSSTNFRKSIATIKPYKGTRPTEKPEHWQAIRDFLCERYEAEIVLGKEADDELGLQQTKAFHLGQDTIICSRDKDLDLIPGKHYKWGCGNKCSESYYVDPIDAWRNFFCQLLIGDTVDNILGLYGVGSKSTLVKQVRKETSVLGMYAIVRKAYEDRFGSYWFDPFMVENAKLLWIEQWNKDWIWIEDYLDYLGYFYEEEREEKEARQEDGDESSVQI